MRRECLFFTTLLVLILFFSEDVHCKICQSMDIRNNITYLSNLKDCKVVVGSLQIVLIEKFAQADFDDYSFPDLTEITGYLLMYRVVNLTSVAKLFPNLRVIRGVNLFTDYSLAIYDMPDMKEIGLTKLLYIGRGGVKVDKCPKLCFVDTVHWPKIGTKIHFSNKNNGICPSCDRKCNGYCWNEFNCQQLDTDLCHKECLGCTQYNSASHCSACKTFYNNGTCVSKCPEGKYMNRYASKCVTAEECKGMLNGTWWTFNNECVKTCPPKYEIIDKDKGGCRPCGTDCVKTCKSPNVIDNHAYLEELNGCTHIDGHVDLRLMDKDFTIKELEDNLGQIKYIKDYLKISRSTIIRSLSFLKNLKYIEGDDLENKRYALFIYENQNLEKLWNMSGSFNFTIKQGTIAFHDNPQLCYSEIMKFAQAVGLKQNVTPNDVSKYSNGDKATCYTVNLKVEFLEKNPTNVTLRWDELDSPTNESYIIGYTIYYTEHATGNISTYESKDVCDGKGWDSVFASNNTQQLRGLNAFTRYAFYIKIYRSSLIGTQSNVMYFTTLSDDPNPPIDVEAFATSSTSIQIKWKHPKTQKGILAYYEIISYREPDSREFVDNRNYCRHKHVSNIVRIIPTTPATTTTTPALPSDSENALDCVCPDKNEVQIFNQDVYHLCFDGPVYGYKGCNAIAYNLLDRDRRDPVKKDKPIQSIERINVSPSLTGYHITKLTHYTLYVFMIFACNENRTQKQQCSSVIQVSERTLKDPNADNITKLGIAVKDTDVSINWTEPKQPNSLIVAYEIQYKNEYLQHSTPSTECITRDQHVTSKNIFKLQSLTPGKYWVRVRAISLAGPGKFIETSFIVEESAMTPLWGIYVIVILLLIGSAIAGIVVYKWYQKKVRLENMRLIRSINPDYAGAMYIADDWELERNDIQILDKLGKGTFGEVFCGLIISRNIPCAIKTVHETLPLHEKMEFLNEASVMKRFSDAHHVVKLLGVVSKGQPPLVVMELMERGDLKSYLRRLRDSTTQTITCNEMYRMAIEIADGMMYLAAKKFVHRDLAARNCMVSSDRTIKVGDFGMARDIYETDYYRKQNKGLLPVRWMAPESLADGVFTTDSDVWSYGVVLWEMATLAEQPYQGLSNEQVFQFVRARGKLERPQECTDLLFEIMNECWNWRPIDRPMFVDIVEKLETHVGQDFRLVSFYHSREGNDYYRTNPRERAYNPPALDVLNTDAYGHYNVSDEEVSLYTDSYNSSYLPYANQRRSRLRSD